MIKQLKNNNTLGLKQYYSSDCDIFIEILHIFRTIHPLTTPLTIKHIKGHQDRDCNINELPQQALLTTNLDRNDHVKITMSRSRAKLYCNGQLVTSHHTKHLREAYHTIAIRQFLKTSNNWTDNIFDDIWWDPIATAMHT
jgi:hypothetical protein